MVSRRAKSLSRVVIRARLAEADADFAAGNTVEDSDAFWRTRLDQLQETIVF